MSDAAKLAGGARVPRAKREDALLSLARAAAAGEKDAVGTLVLEIGGPMLRTVRKVLGRSHPDLEDVTQDAVMALLRSLPDFRAECSVMHFANRVALLTALAARRQLRFRGRIVDAEVAIDGAPDVAAASPLTDAIASRRRELMLGLLERLPEATAEALGLHFVLGFTVEEIASTAGVPENTVWSRLRLGKKALRRGFTNDARLAEHVRKGAR